MTPPPSAESSGVVEAICSAVDACQHAVGQDVVGRDERGEVGDAQPPRPCPCPGSAAGGCRPRRCRPTRTSTSTRSRSSRPVAPARRRARNCWSATPAAAAGGPAPPRNQAAPGGPSRMPSPTASGRCRSGTSWVALGQFGRTAAGRPTGRCRNRRGASPSDPRRVRCRAREPPEPGNLVRHRVVAGSAPWPMAAVKSRSVRMPTRCWPRRPERCRPGASSCGRPPRPGPRSPGR